MALSVEHSFVANCEAEDWLQQMHDLILVIDAVKRLNDVPDFTFAGSMSHRIELCVRTMSGACLEEIRETVKI